MSIEWKLPITGGMLLLAAIAAVLVAGYLNMRASAERAAVERLPDVVGQLVGGMERQSRSLNRALSRVASDSAVQNYFAGPTTQSETAARTLLQTIRRQDTTVAAAEFQDAQGKRLIAEGLATDQLPSLSPEDLPHSDGGHDSASVGRFQADGKTLLYPVIATVISSGTSIGRVIVWRRVSRDTAARARTARLIGSEATIYIGSAHGAWTDQIDVVAPPPVDVTRSSGTLRYTREHVGRRLADAASVPGTPWIVLVEFPEDVILAPARHYLRQVALISLAVFVIGFGAAWLFSRRLTAPLRRLTAVAGTMSTGAHAVEVPVEREDELGRLAEAFNNMVARVDAEAAARDASEEQWRVLFERNPHPMWVYLSETLEFAAVNDAAIRQYGWSRGEFLGMTVHAVVPPEDGGLVDMYVARARSGDDSHMTLRQIRRDGSVFEAEIVAQTTTFGGRSARLVLAQDLSHRQALETQLRQAQKMEAIGRLAGGVAHDFNNILLVISAYAEMLHDSLEPNASKRMDLTEVIDAVGRGRSLTRQLLVFSRQQVLQATVIDPNAAIRDVEAMLRRLLGATIEITSHLAPNIGRVRADPSQLQQVLLNLAVNARDAMPMGGRLTLVTTNADVDEASREIHGLSTTGRFVVIAVTDNGSGMSAETRARIFEPFFTTKEPGKGTGLGLATVYGIVTQSGGDVTVYTELGHGTTFRVYLPAVDAQASQDDRSHPARPSGTETILLVEDEAAVRVAAAGILKHLGYKVLVAESAADALKQAAETREEITLVISDVIMPQMDGPTLAGRLRLAYPALKVLLMSGYTGDALPGRAAFEGEFAFIEKPFSIADLAQKVRDVIDGPVNSAG